jgi:hypothetical protein
MCAGWAVIFGPRGRKEVAGGKERGRVGSSPSGRKPEGETSSLYSFISKPISKPI